MNIQKLNYFKNHAKLDGQWPNWTVKMLFHQEHPYFTQ